LTFANGHAFYAQPGEGFAYVIELKGLDDGHDQFHRSVSLLLLFPTTAGNVSMQCSRNYTDCVFHYKGRARLENLLLF